jgi:hypothetical protein
VPLDLTPIALEELSEGLRKVLGPAAPAPLRMMAARGLAPLRPAEQLAALYQLSLDADPALAQTARKTAAELPDRLVQPALPEALDPRVLDFFARQLTARPALLEPILINRAVDDETFVYLAGACDERELEIIAANEERVLRCPRILSALYLNRRARQSTVDRLIELLARNGVRCDDIPVFDEAVQAIADQGPPVFDGFADRRREKVFRRYESQRILLPALLTFDNGIDGRIALLQCAHTLFTRASSWSFVCIFSSCPRRAKSYALTLTRMYRVSRG